MSTNWKPILGILLAGIAGGFIIVWLVYFNGPKATETTETPTSFGGGEIRTTTSVSSGSDANGTIPASVMLSSKKVFKIADGPIANATLIDLSRPTSTVARYMSATNGHTFDLLLDSQGAVPKAISNTTIPGIQGAKWSTGGTGVIFQYLDNDLVKTVHLSLPAPSATSTRTRIQYLPDNILSFALSPSGAEVAYLLKSASGSDGYVARFDGGEPRKLFSLPFSQIQLSWNAPSTLLAQTSPATGVSGVVFSIDASSGSVVPLIHAAGLTALSDRSFSRVVYQTADSASRSTFAQNVKTGLSNPLSFDPVPELCTWSLATSTTLYCATPLLYVAPNYLDLLHLGAAGTPMGLVSYHFNTGRSEVIARPGGSDGGEQIEIAEMAVSASDKYLLFVTKGDRSLWGVRLSQ